MLSLTSVSQDRSTEARLRHREAKNVGWHAFISQCFVNFHGSHCAVGNRYLQTPSGALLGLLDHDPANAGFPLQARRRALRRRVAFLPQDGPQDLWAPCGGLAFLHRLNKQLASTASPPSSKSAGHSYNKPIVSFMDSGKT